MCGGGPALTAGGVPASDFKLVGNGNAAHIYLTARKAPDAAQKVKRMRDTLLGGPRTGDLVVTTSPGVGVLDTSEANSLPLNPLAGNHGAPFTRDNTFLITGGSAALRQSESDAPAINVDVTPTAMRLLNRKPAKTVEGSFRRDAFKVKALPKRGGKR